MFLIKYKLELWDYFNYGELIIILKLILNNNYKDKLDRESLALKREI